MAYNLAHTGWTNRRKESGRVLVDLVDADGQVIGTFPRDAVGTETVEVAGAAWRIDATQDELRATLPSGETFSAKSDGKKFSRAHRINVALGDLQAVAVNEQRMDWVYLAGDENGAKIGQFSGGNNGARNSYTEFDGNVAVSAEQAAFLSWVSRTVNEAKLSNSTLVLTISLLILTPLILFMLL